MQAASDPEHPNKWPNYPLTLLKWVYRNHKINCKCTGRDDMGVKRYYSSETVSL